MHHPRPHRVTQLGVRVPDIARAFSEASGKVCVDGFPVLAGPNHAPRAALRPIGGALLAAAARSAYHVRVSANPDSGHKVTLFPMRTIELAAEILGLRVEELLGREY